MEDKRNNMDVLEHFLRLSRTLRRQQTSSHGHDKQHHNSDSPAGSKGHGGARLLAVLASNDGVRSNQLAELLDIRPPSLTQRLNRLEEMGLIERRRDEIDSRAIRVFLTDKGREHLRAKKTEQLALAARIDACLTLDEQAQFCALCDKLGACLAPEAQ